MRYAAEQGYTRRQLRLNESFWWEGARPNLVAAE
jgi:hypothetical protein